MEAETAVSWAFVVAGTLLLASLILDALAHRSPLPRVTLLILLGVLIGPIGLDVLGDRRETLFPVLSTLALAMIGFLLGEEFTGRALRERGRTVLIISMGQSLGTVVVIAAGLMALGVSLSVALPLAGIGAATAPASTIAVLDESGRRDQTTEVLRGVVAFDDLWGILLFSLLIAIASGLTGDGRAISAITLGAWEILGAGLLGVAIGIPAAAVTGRLRPGEPTLEEALGIVLLSAGLAQLLEVSFILTAVVLGATVANRASHHTRPFHEIERIRWPFMVLFFVVAGAGLEFGALQGLGLVGGGYVVLRVTGKVGGSWVGSVLAHQDGRTGGWLGLALLPQAGVALGLALVAAERFPDANLLPVAVGTTVLFEIAGPPLTRLALNRMAPEEE